MSTLFARLLWVLMVPCMFLFMFADGIVQRCLWSNMRALPSLFAEGWRELGN